MCAQVKQSPNVLILTWKCAKVLPWFGKIEWLLYVSFLALLALILAVCIRWFCAIASCEVVRCDVLMGCHCN